MRFALPWLCVLALVGCDWADDRDPDADRPVVTVTICPDGGCSYVADGKTPIVVRVATGAASRPADLTAEVHTSIGQWGALWVKEGSPTIAEVNLSAQPTEDLQVLPPSEAGPLTIQATLKGHRATAVVQLTGACLGADVLMHATPPGLDASSPTTVMVTAAIRTTSGGAPTAGTLATFSAEPTPAGTPVILSAPRVLVDQDGNATTSLLVGAPVQSIRITVHVEAPRSATCSADGAGSITADGDITLSTIPKAPE